MTQIYPIIGVDTETALIQPGLLAPRLICLSTSQRDESSKHNTGLYLHRPGIAWLREQLTSKVVLAIHNASFDMGVVCAEEPELLPLVFDAYREGRIRCTIVRQKLLDIAFGMRKFRRTKRDGQTIVTKASYGLKDLIAYYYNEHLQKEDTWRLSYGLLDDVPLELWPENAKSYAIKDAIEHVRIYEAQESVIREKVGGQLPNQPEQQQAAWALHLMSMWGVRAEGAAVERFIEHCEIEIAKMRDALKDTGIFNPKTGARIMIEIRRRVVEACLRLKMPVPMTDPSAKFPRGQVQTDKEALEATDDPKLHVLAASMTFAKHLGQWGPVCKAAVLRPVCARYEVLVETGRTACSGSEGQEGTNFQNPPRKGDVRPCFIARSGFLYCSTDADTIELRALAQCNTELVGWSRMADALWDQHKNSGPDLHLRLAAGIMGIAIDIANGRYKEGDSEVDAARQFAKIPGFGFPGGLGPDTMVTYAAAQLDKETHQRWFGVEREEQIAKAKNLREIWFETWPEMRLYFKIIGKMIDGNTGEGIIRQLMSGRIRGGVRFTAAANGFFQARVADAMKEVLFHLADECYTGRCASKHVHGGSNICTVQGRSILFGSRPAMFLHDEPILEHPEDGTQSNRAERQRQIVVEGLEHWLPAVPCTSAAVLTRRWHKGAKSLYINGDLVPVKPEVIVREDGSKKVSWIEDVRQERMVVAA